MNLKMKLSSYSQKYNRKLSDSNYMHKHKQRLSLIANRIHLGKFSRVESFYVFINSSPQRYISFDHIVYPAGYATLERRYNMRGSIPISSHINMPRRTLSGFSCRKIPLRKRGF